MQQAEINLESGAILNNVDLCKIFKCSPQGGMRRSHTTNTLVIVSNHIKSIYDDRWIGEIFHYTGTGSEGDQSLSFSQNKTLTESQENGVRIHLFEVFVDQEYTYIGQVKLAESPYFEPQPDKNDQSRLACVFPLKLADLHAPVLPIETIQEPFNLKIKKAKRLSDSKIKIKAENAKRSYGSRTVISKQYHRDPWIAEYAKRRAQGVCQLCESPAPFINKANEPYLETHHIEWLSQGGEDVIENTVSLCPNCHRKMHIINCSKDIKKLKMKASMD